MPSVTEQSRRRFLKFVAASPLFATAALAGEGPMAPVKPTDPIIWAPLQTDKLIKSPKDAINVFDFEAPCRVNVPPSHFGYMASGIDDEVTLRANREGFLKFQLRPRRLVDVSKVDMSTDILGVKYDTPIVVAPVGGHNMFHPDGEIATAKGAKVGNHLMILSTATTTGVEDVTTARGAPVWYQLMRRTVGTWRRRWCCAPKSRLPGRRRDSGPLRRPQPGNAVPVAADRHA